MVAPMTAPPMAPNFTTTAPNFGMAPGVSDHGVSVKPNDTEQKIIQQVATLVASGGEETEEAIKKQHLDDPDYWFLFNKTNPLYQDYQKQLLSIRNQNRKEKMEQHQRQQEQSLAAAAAAAAAVAAASTANDADTEDDGGQSCPGLGFKSRKRKSRWGSQEERAAVSAPTISAPPGLATLMPAGGSGGGGATIRPLMLPSAGPSNPPMAPVARAPVGTPMPGVAKPQLLPLMQKSDALRKAMARKYTGSDEISETQLKQIQ